MEVKGVERRFKVEYDGLIPSETLEPAGLKDEDVKLSIELAKALRHAVKVHRVRTRETALPPEESEEQRKARVNREEAEDNMIFLGAAPFLAQRMKPEGK
jgi:hypothetical protein